MNERERFLRVMRYQQPDKVPLWSFGAWPETIQRWQSEGYDQAKLRFRENKRLWAGGWFFPCPGFEHEIVSEDDHTITYINHEGILLREQKNNPYSSMPQFIKFPVETREDFRKFWKERMNPDLKRRIGENYAAELAKHRERDYPLIVVADRWGGFFGPLRNLLGVENLCVAFCEDPAFVEEMMEANADFIIEVIGEILNHTDIDVFGFWEDMAYKTAPLISPAMTRKFMLPRYRRVVDYLNSRGVEFISLDSDGQMSSLIPVWLDSGINILYPFEVQCGMDVLKVRREYGRGLGIWYGVDKRCAAWGKAEIDAELSRVEPLVREGGYIPGPDHSFPPDVSYENYCYFMEKLSEIL
jgi:uroporphyrinogen decarboxylase